MNSGPPTCWRCGFRPLVNPGENLHRLGVTIDGEDWPEIHVCEDCAKELSAELGALHLYDKVTEA
ncbi:hypothetical protein RH831_08950 [Halodesulfurarchaeum sp. HSR-GB]|uniref:hypothetical protein n=1 Tax=Halodesulfurarchaeum sp. HSR-GB TaxID=3074077 RepID=UPI00285F977D|nr:hypothetical protein [Halodesulfurarchaeum sp. HSR-GB]MDR5657307.1 hypothetical protein [Halodesulfurarchaeum sp. HSR-GB]